MMFTIENIMLETWILLGISIVSLLYMLLFGMRPWLVASRHAGKCADKAEDSTTVPDTTVPKVTVVVYCQSDRERLLATLSAICAQDYPDFDVVAVCDAGAEFAADISEMLPPECRNVYVTYLQPGSHNLSRRKLANTIGIKAAKGEVVVTTRANIIIPSGSWLSGLMQPFLGPQGKYIDVVTGITHFDFAELHGPRKWFRRFDTLLDDALWVGYTAEGHPYRGDGFNLALRRKAFFDNKGYSQNMYLLNGEDDVYLRQICTPANTRAVTTPDTVLTTVWEDSANRIWAMRKASYEFTRRWLPRSPYLRAGSVSLMQWLVTSTAVAAAVTGLPSLCPAIAAALVVIALWTSDIICYRRTAMLFGEKTSGVAAPLFWLWRPVAGFLFKMSHIGTYKKNFTWQR